MKKLRDAIESGEAICNCVEIVNARRRRRSLAIVACIVVGVVGSILMGVTIASAASIFMGISIASDASTFGVGVALIAAAPAMTGAILILSAGYSALRRGRGGYYSRRRKE